MSQTSVALLGATGSIGSQTLEVLRREPERFRLTAIAGGGGNIERLIAIAREFQVLQIGVPSNELRELLLSALPGSHVVVGDEGLKELASSADTIVNAVVGFAGLPVTLAGLEAGKRLALANKESLIAAAPLVEKVRHTPGAELLPIDSEHCAIHQALAGASSATGYRDVRRLILTASGGPFRGWTSEALDGVTKDKALAHPTWTMGPKITIDSSTLMNKGLEVLEASALFGIGVDRVDVVIHPQSIVHSMVEYVDGSVIAQLSKPDMRLPIAYCLGMPERLDHAWGALDFREPLTLEFSPPDLTNFPALPLAYEAARIGGAAPAWMSAANEVAVAAFLADRISWRQIVEVVSLTLSRYEPVGLTSLSELLEADARARQVATANLPQ
ncbi:MAG: 1-deoxy-D-xylulose-5-phosphate reductoisomerase [Actinomycetota bacterium]